MSYFWRCAMTETRFLPSQFVYDRLEEQFKPDRVTDIFPKKGLQFDFNTKIHKVYTATFANPSVIKEILKRGETDIMLFTHHPRPPMPSLQANYAEIPEDLIEQMKERRISLFSYHIPMDAGYFYSPAYTLGEALGGNIYDFWYPQNNGLIGVLCSSGFDTITELRNKFIKVLGHKVSCTQYGGEKLIDGKFAVMPGCSKSLEAYKYLKENGVNVLVTGVTSPVVDWSKEVHEAAKANGITLLAGTHCSTEQFAPRKMCGYFQNLGLESEFIPETPNFDELDAKNIYEDGAK